MNRVKEIIKEIDDNLVETGKSYLLLGQANELLMNKKLITFEERHNQFLKKLLQENKLPHAYQTEKTPKQWRIPHSEKKSEKKVKKKIIKEPQNTILYCPECYSENMIILDNKHYRCNDCYKILDKAFAQFYSKEFKDPIKETTEPSISTKKYWENYHRKYPAFKIVLVIAIIFLIGKCIGKQNANNTEVYKQADRTEIYYNDKNGNPYKRETIYKDGRPTEWKYYYK